MITKSLVIGTVAAIGLAFSAYAGDAPGTGPVTHEVTSLADGAKTFNMVDNFGDTYNLVVNVTGKNPQQGTISGSSIACLGSGSYSVSGSFFGTSVNMNNTLQSGGSCVSFSIQCTWDPHTKTCSGTFTNQGDGGGSIVLSKQ